MTVASLSSNPASILVVDDDRRVVELLTIALNAYGYRVIQATDGEEALRLASRERPDLVVLDVRLPKRSGYEVCEMLRQDPDDPELPIIMVSAAAETEARLQGLARGADDYVAKPFSPKELIARIRRLLSRSEQARDARRRSREAEHELGQAREEARRSQAELRDQLRLRDLADGFTRDFHASLDLEMLSRRLLLEAQAHLGSGTTALLGTSSEADLDLRVVAVRGPAPERATLLRIEQSGELRSLLEGLGRPVRRRDLDRFPELRGELQPFIVAGVSVLAPLRDAEGLVGVVVADERLDGAEMESRQLEALGVLCDTASRALRNARRAHLQSEALLEALEALARQAVDGQMLDEAARLLESRAVALPAESLRDVGRGIRLMSWTLTAEGAATFRATAGRDGSGRLPRLARWMEAAADADACFGDDADPLAEAAAALLRWGLAYARSRAEGRSPESAHQAALDGAGEHPALDVLRGVDSPTASRSR